MAHERGSSNRCDEWVDNLQIPINHLTVLHVFRQQEVSTCISGAGHNKAVPKGKGISLPQLRCVHYDAFIEGNDRIAGVKGPYQPLNLRLSHLRLFDHVHAKFIQHLRAYHNVRQRFDKLCGDCMLFFILVKDET